MIRRGIFIGGLAALGAAIVAGFRLGADGAPNVTRTTPSGDDLSADRSMLLVDIRRPEEWVQTGVVQGALLVTYTEPNAFLAAITPHLEEGQKIGLICRSGNRTSRAARQIAGLTNATIVDIGGGMLRVMAEGYKPVAPTRAMGCGVC